MPQLNSDNIGQIMSFNVYPDAVLGSEFSFVEFLGIGSVESAFQYIDPASLHANVYPTLPVGTPNDFRAYKYVTIKFPSGKITALGLPWINQNTVVIHQNVRYRVDVVDSTPEQYEVIRNALLQNGVTKFTITPY